MTPLDAIREALIATVEETKRQLERMRGLLDGVLSEAGMQAHRMGCEKRLKRHRDWNDFAPCRGCAAEAALEESR